MAKFYGTIGYELPVERDDEPGVFDPTIVERKYRGDINRIVNHGTAGEKLVNDLKLNMEVEIIADAFAYQNFAYIRYISYMNSKWDVTSVQVRRPRIVLNFGGVYNAE